MTKSEEGLSSSAKLSRRDLLRGGAGLALTSFVASGVSSGWGAENKKVRVGMVGVGHRGTHLLNILLSFEDVDINAIADITPGNLARAQAMVEQKRGKRPEGYGAGPEDFRKLVLRDDLDAVIAATSWEWHTPVAVAAMKAGKYAGIEVPAATTVQECWDLVNTSEGTGVPCMMLENVCYFRDMLTVLNMVRQGALGELIHCAAGYQHDCREYCFDENGNFSKDEFAPSDGPSYQTWYTAYALNHNGNLYPTHAVGPIGQYLNINRGDRFTYLVSMSSKGLGLNLWVKHKFGPDHPNARRTFAEGDISTTLIKTHGDCTIALYFDNHSPRPYDLAFRVQGTNGIYMMTRDSIYVEGEGKAAAPCQLRDGSGAHPSPCRAPAPGRYWADEHGGGRGSGAPGRETLPGDLETAGQGPRTGHQARPRARARPRDVDPGRPAGDARQPRRPALSRPAAPRPARLRVPAVRG